MTLYRPEYKQEGVWHSSVRACKTPKKAQKICDMWVDLYKDSDLVSDTRVVEIYVEDTEKEN